MESQDPLLHKPKEGRPFAGVDQSASPMKILLVTRQGKSLGDIELPASATVEEFRALFYQKLHYYPERQWFNIGDAKGEPLKEGTLSDNGLTDGSVLVFKDLGVQISWRLVFVIEYLGPLLLFPAFYYLPAFFYSDMPHDLVKTTTQKVAFWLAIGHFIKREVETLFVHRFSNATMPIIRLPINCAHYWIIFGAMVGYFLFHPRYTAPFSGPIPITLLACAMLVFEFLNFNTHLVLRRMRPRGTKTRGIPYGWGFDTVSCANYLWEILAWISFSILTCTVTAWFFLIVATAQMTQWALKRHSAYRREFAGYPRSRKAIFPLIL